MKPGDIFTLRVPYMAERRALPSPAAFFDERPETRRIECGERLICTREEDHNGDMLARVFIDQLSNGDSPEYLVPTSYTEEVKQ